MKSNNLFDTEFRRRARDIKTKPNAELWSRLEGEMQTARRISLFQIASIAAGLVLLLGAVALFTSNDGEFSNPNYQLSEVTTDDGAEFQVALMEWIDQSKDVNPK